MGATICPIAVQVNNLPAAYARRTAAFACDLWVTVHSRNCLRPRLLRRIHFLGCVWVCRSFSPGLWGRTSADFFARRERK